MHRRGRRVHDGLQLQQGPDGGHGSGPESGLLPSGDLPAPADRGPDHPPGQRHHLRPALPLAIATTCEDIELAIRFCDFLYTRQGFEYANYGVEGYDAAWVIPTGITLTAEETEEYSSRYSDIQTYVAESIPKFIMGELNLDSDWDSFVASVKTMGIERCCEIYQGAVARYNAR